MDEVVVGRGQGPGSSQAEMGGPDGHTHGESSGDAAAKLQAALADDTTLRERADPLVLRVFGEDVMRRMLSKNWKLREEGVMRADVCLSTWGDQRDGRRRDVDGRDLFEAGCSLARLACSDKVSQVFIASMPFLRTLLSGADGSVTVPRGSQLVAEVPASSRGGEMDVGGGDTGELSDPVIGAVLRDLLARAGGSQERTAGEAMEMLLAIATTTRLGPVPVARITLGDNSSGAKWRPLVARVRIMERLLCDFGLSTPSGLEVGPIMALAADALNNASVKARQCGLGLVARVAPLFAAAEDLDAARAVQLLSEDYLASVKPSLLSTAQEKMHAALQAAADGGDELVNKVVADAVASPSTRGHKASASTPGSAKRSAKRKGRKSRKPKADADEADDGELPYAEPLAESMREAAAPVSMLFGQDVARCAFSKDWRPRAAAIRHMAAKFKELLAQLRDATGDADASSATTEPIVGQLVTALGAAQPVLDAALEDKVNQVYVVGLRLLKRVLRAVNDVRAASRRLSRQAAEDMVQGLRQPLRTVVLRVGDTKTRVRTASEEIILYTARVPTLGPVFAAEAVLSSDAALPVPPGGDSKPVVPGPLGEARLRLLSQLVHSVGLNPDRATAAKGPGLPLYPILSFAVRDLQSREQRVRAAAAELLFAARQHGEKHDFAPVVAAAVAKLPIEIRDRVKDKLDSLAMEANARAELAQAVAAAGAAPGAGAGVVAGAGAVEQPAASPNRSSGGVQFSRIETNPHGAPSPMQLPRGGGIAHTPSPKKTPVSLRPRTSAKRESSGRVRGGLFTTSGGAAERTAASEKLPYAEAIDEEVLPEVAGMVASLGDQVVRCALSKTWSVREAALRETIRQLQLAAKPANPDDAQDVAVLMACSTLVERAMQDSVAKVYQVGLHLLLTMVREYLAAVPGKDFLVRAALQPAIRAVVVRTGDNNERVRRVSTEALVEVARCPTVAASLVGEVVMEVIRNMEGGGSAGVGLSSRLRLLKPLIDEFGLKVDGVATGRASGLNVDEVMEVVLPAFEDRHLDVRSAATEVYASVYCAVKSAGGDTSSLQQHVSTLRPAIRRSIRDAVSAAMAEAGSDFAVDSPVSNPNTRQGIAQSPGARSPAMRGRMGGMVRARSNAALPQPGSPLSRGAQGGLTSPMRGLQHPASGAPQPLAKRSGSFRLMAQDSKALVALFGVDIAAMIRGEDWRGRREGLWLAAEQINAGTVGSPPTTGHRGDDGSSHPAWHTVLELLKAALMDAKPQVNIASLDVLQAVLAQSVDVVLSDGGGLGISGISVGGTGGSGSSGGQKDAHSKPSPVAIPWGDWEARLGLGSFVKTVMDKTSDPHVRVRSAASEMASLIAHAHATGWQLISRHVLQAVTVPNSSVAIAADDLTSAMALAKTSRVLVGRLRCLRELLDMQEREGGVGTGGGTAIGLDQALTFCAVAARSTSTLVQHLALSCAISAARQAVSFGGGDAGVQAVRAFVSSADAATRTVLQPVLQAVHGGSDERGATPGSTVSGAGGQSDGDSTGWELGGRTLSSHSFGASARGAGLTINPPQSPCSVGSGAYTPKHGRRAVRASPSSNASPVAMSHGGPPSSAGSAGSGGFGAVQFTAGTQDADGNDAYTPGHGRRSVPRQASFGRRGTGAPTTPGGTTNPGFSPIRNERTARDGQARRLGRPPASPLGPSGSFGSLGSRGSLGSM